MIKKFTINELKNSPNTIMKFFFEKKTPTIKDIEEGKQFYKKNSTGKYNNLRPSRFIKMYKSGLEVYNNRIK